MERRQDFAESSGVGSSSISSPDGSGECDACHPFQSRKKRQATLDAYLVQSVCQQDPEGTFEALQQGANPNAQADEGMNVIHFASLYGNANLLHALIEHNADTNLLCSGSGLSPLHFAVLMGHAASVRILLEEGFADPNIASSLSARTPLQIAVTVPRPESVQIAETLIAFGADVMVLEDDDLNLLHVCGNDPLMVKLLVDSGVSPTARSKTDLTPLHLACLNGNLTKVKALVELGVGVNDDCSTDDGIRSPLHCACDGGHIDVVRYLVEEQDADPFCKDRNGKLPIHQACKMKHKRIVDFFLNACEIFPDTPDSNGNTCLHWVCRKVHNVDTSVVYNLAGSLLHRMPSIINIANLEGQTALHHASFWSANLCQILVECWDADLTKKDRTGQTPLLLAARHADVGDSTASYLAGMTVELHPSRVNDTDNMGWTALHWASFRYDERLIRILLEVGADANVSSVYGRRPLHLVGRFQIPTGLYQRDLHLDSVLDKSIVFQSRTVTNESVQALLEAGADSIASDHRGDLPFFLAATTGSVNDTYQMMRAATGKGLFNNLASQMADE
eukprot:scaffold34719_cov241-Amphora_coffeaeformis.AAC.2